MLCSKEDIFVQEKKEINSVPLKQFLFAKISECFTAKKKSLNITNLLMEVNAFYNAIRRECLIVFKQSQQETCYHLRLDLGFKVNCVIHKHQNIAGNCKNSQITDASTDVRKPSSDCFQKLAQIGLTVIHYLFDSFHILAI